MLFSERVKTKLLRKLKSKTGASIVMGLMFFLLCFFVSGVILASAAVNVSRAAAQKEEQQAYLAINAAANLLHGEVDKLQGFTAAETLITHDCHLCDAEYDYEVDGLTQKNDAKPSSLTTPLNDLLTTLFLSRTKTDYEKLLPATDTDKINDWKNAQSFNVEDWVKELDIEADDMPTVHVRMTADKAYHLYMELTVDSRRSASFAMTVEFTATCSVTPNVTPVPDACEHEKVEMIETGTGEWSAQVQTQKFAKQVSRTVTSIQWTGMEITKGTLEDQLLLTSNAEGEG